MSERELRDELIDRLADYESCGVYTGTEIRVVAEHVIDHLLPVVRRAVDQARAEQVRPLMSAEHMVYTVARNQIRRGDNPPINTTAGLLATIERLAGIKQAADEQEAPHA